MHSRFSLMIQICTLGVDGFIQGIYYLSFQPTRSALPWPNPTSLSRNLCCLLPVGADEGVLHHAGVHAGPSKPHDRKIRRAVRPPVQHRRHRSTVGSSSHRKGQKRGQRGKVQEERGSEGCRLEKLRTEHGNYGRDGSRCCQQRGISLLESRLLFIIRIVEVGSVARGTIGSDVWLSAVVLPSMVHFKNRPSCDLAASSAKLVTVTGIPSVRPLRQPTRSCRFSAQIAWCYTFYV